MLELWKKHISTASFSLKHYDPNVFVISQWQRKPHPNVVYLIYRVLITVYLVIAWLLSIIDEQNLDKPYPFHLKWLIYLTNWGFTFCTFQALLCTSMLCAQFAKARRGEFDDIAVTKRLHKIYWFCFTVGIDLGIAITILYWVVIYNPTSTEIDYLNVLVHCTNSAVMIIELCVVSHPVRLMHVYVPITSGVAYTLFSLFYHLAGGTSRIDEPYIYPVVDWRKPIPTLLVCLGACVFLVIIHVATYVVYRIRRKLANKFIKTDDQTNIPVQETFRGLENDCLAVNEPV